MKLHDLQPAAGSRKPRTRVGRGIAAGKGKTAGRGTKGQKARAGGGIPAWFEGGQTPLHMRIPKLRGFKNRFKIEYEVVNIGAIGALAERGAFEVEDDRRRRPRPAPITVNQDILRAVGLVRTLNKPLKILGAGELTVPLFVVADAFTASARAKIEAAGGSVNVLEVPTTPLAALGVTPETAAAKPPRRDRSRRGRRARRGDGRTPRPRPPRPSRRDSRRGSGPGKRAKHRRQGREREGADGEGSTEKPLRSQPRAPRLGDDRCRRRAAADEPVRPTSRPRDRRRRRRPTPTPADDDRTTLRRRRLTRVRIPSQRLPRARYPAPDPLCPRAADRLPAAGRGADPGRRQGAADDIRRRATRSSACSTCSPAAGSRTSRSSPWA